ncbi:MAG: coenzyme A pyrophosphatase [Alteromonadaceae bacterium]|nr:MAG: coenzyme A pyrophosphatase [Alteromonadaceae bacterium]
MVDKRGKQANPRGLDRKAAVLIVEAGVAPNQRVLLTQRSEHLSSHSGEVAFPGGMWDPEDGELAITALRESHEEVGLAPDRVSLLGSLEPSTTRMGVEVTPFVGRVDNFDGLVASPDELQSIFSVPLSYLLEDPRERTDLFLLAGGDLIWSPVYMYEGYEIWGFTARTLIEYLNQFHGAGIFREHSAQELLFKSS